MIDSILTEAFEILLGFIAIFVLFFIFVAWITRTSTPIFYDYLKIKWKMIQSSLNQ